LAAILFARDLKERSHWIAITDYFASPDEALAAAEQKVDEVLPALGVERELGDEQGRPVDFFRPVRAPERLNPDLVRLATEEGYFPARGIIEPSRCSDWPMELGRRSAGGLLPTLLTGRQRLCRDARARQPSRPESG
jgi:hypothetical protein